MLLEGPVGGIDESRWNEKIFDIAKERSKPKREHEIAETSGKDSISNTRVARWYKFIVKNDVT